LPKKNDDYRSNAGGNLLSKEIKKKSTVKTGLAKRPVSTVDTPEQWVDEAILVSIEKALVAIALIPTAERQAKGYTDLIEVMGNLRKVAPNNNIQVNNIVDPTEKLKKLLGE
jgi:hypothetical protein